MQTIYEREGLELPIYEEPEEEEIHRVKKNKVTFGNAPGDDATFGGDTINNFHKIKEDIQKIKAKEEALLG